MAAIQLENVSKVYPNGAEAVRHLDLEVDDGEFLVLVGPSGCGKTTVLRMVAGLEEISGGTIRIGGRIVNDLSPRERDIAMVFQNYALYPQLTVGENIGFPLKQRKVPKPEIRKKVAETAEILGLDDWLNRKPAQLSGGQRQRVAMGRAIVREPAAFLMDEPLSNLDAKLRVQMRAEIASLQRRLGVATLYVTHDQVEAMTMGHRVAVLRDGVLQQCDEPQILYDRPTNLFVAAFIGSPPMNLFEARLDADGLGMSFGDQRITLGEEERALRPGLARYRGERVIVGFRPENLSAVLDGSDDEVLRGEVQFVEALGSDLLVHFSIGARAARTGKVADQEGDLEDTIGANCTARADPHIPVKTGEAVAYRLDANHLQFFDPASEAAVWA